jgi:hypothetical protein
MPQTDLMNNGFWSEARSNPVITALLDDPTDWVARNKVSLTMPPTQARWQGSTGIVCGGKSGVGH